MALFPVAATLAGIWLANSVVKSTGSYQIVVLWSYPAVLVVFGKVVEYLPWRDTDRLRKVLFFAPLIVVQALAFRVFLPIPGDEGGQLFDPGAAPALLLSVYGDAANLGHFYASSMLPGDRITLLIQFSLLAVYFGVLLAVMNRDHKKKVNSLR